MSDAQKFERRRSGREMTAEESAAIIRDWLRRAHEQEAAESRRARAEADAAKFPANLFIQRLQRNPRLVRALLAVLNGVDLIVHSTRSGLEATRKANERVRALIELL